MRAVVVAGNEATITRTGKAPRVYFNATISSSSAIGTATKTTGEPNWKQSLQLSEKE